MIFLRPALFALFLCCCMLTFAQKNAPKKSLNMIKTTAIIKIDGELHEPAWQTAPLADSFLNNQPKPFEPESKGNESQVYFLYDNAGIYVGGYLHETHKDSIAGELTGRDGFGTNDFFGVVFDTYSDKLNAFEYFITPLNEQWDAKMSPANGEDFAWNAVWQSAVKIHSDGWSFEMFIPYSAIRFGNKKVQDWGMNIVRQRIKSGQKSFWQPIDPNINGFLTQEGYLKGFEDIKPPLRLQLSPYFSTYYTHDDDAGIGTKKSNVLVNGGMDVKYGISQAFTLDMTLIPDFGQVQTDNRTLNLTPFEQKFAENRAFFTEGTELFNKGNLFYSRRIGSDSKLINATKISGRTQKGLGVGILNAVTNSEFEEVEDDNGHIQKVQTVPLTNYNIIALDQTLKHNSSISLVNTNVWRSGGGREANVTSALFDFNNKKNVYNIGGNVSFSNIIQPGGKTTTGYSHSIYIGKTSGRFNFNVWQDLINKDYDKSDLGYFTNNNYMEQGVWAGYHWNTPKKWYNQKHLNFNFWYNKLVTPKDAFKGNDLMYQNAGGNINGNVQTKKLWYFQFVLSHNFRYNDFYETRDEGRVFRNKGNTGLTLYSESNSAKKLSGTAGIFLGKGEIFNRTSLNYNGSLKYRFSSKFSVEDVFTVEHHRNQAGWAYSNSSPAGIAHDTIIFSRRNVNFVENILNVKYNFNNKMGITLRARHTWTKVNPLQFYQLDINGDPQTPDVPFIKNVNQNYNFLSADMVYNWQFAQGSFITIAWKDIGESFNQKFERNYTKNLGKIIDGNQFNSFSVRIIYFLDYFTFRSKMKAKKAKST